MESVQLLPVREGVVPVIFVSGAMRFLTALLLQPVVAVAGEIQPIVREEGLVVVELFVQHRMVMVGDRLPDLALVIQRVVAQEELLPTTPPAAREVDCLRVAAAAERLVLLQGAMAVQVLSVMGVPVEALHLFVAVLPVA